MKLTATLTNDSVKEAAGKGSSQDDACPIYVDGAQSGAFTLSAASDVVDATADRIELLFPSTVVGAHAVAKILVATPGWRAEPNDQTLRLTSSSRAKLPLNLQLQGVAATATTVTEVKPLRVSVDCAVPPLQAYVGIMAARHVQGASLLDVLHAELTGADRAPDVYYTPRGSAPISNTLTLHLANVKPAGQPLVSTSWNERTPRISVSFIYGDDAGSLAPAADGNFDARKITIEKLKTYGDFTRSYAWTTTQPDPHGAEAEAVWHLEPEIENTEVLGPKNGAIASFEIRGIRTPALGDTLLYLRFTDFPGYDDTSLALVIHKLDPPRGILRFAASATNVNAGEPVRLSWTTFAVSQLKLTYQDENDDTVEKTSTDEKDPLPLNEPGFEFIPVNSSTTVSLFAYDEFGVPLGDDKQQTITVNVPLVEHFEVTPTAVVPGDKCVLTWRTKHADHCILQPGALPVAASSDRANPLLVAPAPGANVFELRAYTKGGLPSPRSSTATVSLLPQILTLDAEPRVIDPAKTPTKVTLSWQTANPSDLVSLGNDLQSVAGKTSISVDVSAPTVFTLTARQQAYVGAPSEDVRSVAVGTWATKSIAVGAKPVALAVRWDGKKLYVSNAGSNSVSVIDTATRAVVNTIEHVVSPGALFIFARYDAVVRVSDPPLTALVLNLGDDTIPQFPRFDGPMPLGDCTIAFSGDGALAFIDRGDRIGVYDTTTYRSVALTFGGWDPLRLTTLSYLPKSSWPMCAAALLGRRTLYLLDTPNNAVLALDFVYPPCAEVERFTAFPAAVDLSRGAAEVALSWSVRNADASVEIDEAGSVSGKDHTTQRIDRPTIFTLVATGTNGSVAKRRASVGVSRTAAIPVGTNPVAVAMTPDGATLYVANKGSDSVSIIDARRRVVTGTVANVGTSPFKLFFAFGTIWVGYAEHPVDRDAATMYAKIAPGTNVVAERIWHGPNDYAPESIAITADAQTLFVPSDLIFPSWTTRPFPASTVLPVRPWVEGEESTKSGLDLVHVDGDPIPLSAWPAGAAKAAASRTLFAVDSASNSVLVIDYSYLSPP